MLILQSVEPLGGLCSLKVWFGFLTKRDKILGVGSRRRFVLTGLLQGAAGVFADHFERAESMLSALTIGTDQQALVDKRSDRINDLDRMLCAFRITNRFCGIYRKACGKDRQTSEDRLLVRIEQIVTPVDRSPHGSLSFRKVAGAAGKKSQPAFKFRKNVRRSEHTRPSCDKFDRERQAFEPRTDLGDAPGILIRQLKIRIRGLRAFGK